MKNLILALLVSFTFSLNAIAADSFYSLKPNTIDGKPQSLSQYKGKVLLVVNTASKCGFTPQYEGLESLYKKYQEKGFVVLGFPSNDFKQQEPADNSEIKKFCKIHYGVDFPLFEKNPVGGPENRTQVQPVYTWLLANGPNPSEPIGWNFEKYLISRDGKVLGRFKSKVSPADPTLTTAIESALAQ
jgi:glutathione peroxidase